MSDAATRAREIHAYHALADEVERLRALTTVDDAMIERAMVAFQQKRWHTNMAGDALRADLTAALEAALGVES